MEHPSLAEWWHFPFWVFSELFFYLVFAGSFTVVLLLACGLSPLRRRPAASSTRTARLET